MKNQGVTKNKTTFQGELSRLKNGYTISTSLKYMYSRRREFKQRLHFEYEHAKAVGGRAYAWTLTYNDKNVPNFDGINVHDYRDVKRFLNSLNTFFTRNYGVRVEYAVFCELGEQKGKRSAFGNPHYHILVFFLPVPAENKYFNKLRYENNSIVLPKDKEITDMAKYYWQGGQRVRTSDNRVCYDVNNNWLTARFGALHYSVKRNAGPYGRVTSESAISYCIKYCTKDVRKVNAYQRCYEKMYEYAHSKFYLWFHDYLHKFHNDSIEEYSKLSTQEKYEGMYTYLQFCMYVTMESLKAHYTTHHSVKPRSSKNVGHYEDIKHLIREDGTFPMPNRRGVVSFVPLKGYFFRKHYFEVVREYNDKYELQNYYRPRESYIKYRIANLEKAQAFLKKKCIDTLQQIDGFYAYPFRLDEHKTLSEPAQYLCKSIESYAEFVRLLPTSLEDFTNKYVLYKSIYEHRPLNADMSLLDLDPVKDYETFLLDDFCAEHRLYHIDTKQIDYSNHIEFKQLVPYFNYIDALADYVEYENYITWSNQEFHDKCITQEQNKTIYER